LIDAHEETKRSNPVQQVFEYESKIKLKANDEQMHMLDRKM